mgnify:CR=1 FL=1
MELLADLLMPHCGPFWPVWALGWYIISRERDPDLRLRRRLGWFFYSDCPAVVGRHRGGLSGFAVAITVF